MKQKRICLILGIVFCLVGAAFIPIGIVQIVLAANLGAGIALLVLGVILFLLAPVLLLIYGLIDRDCAREYDKTHSGNSGRF